MTRLATLAVALTLALAGCSGPFFYHEVIVPTDPNKNLPAGTVRP